MRALPTCPARPKTVFSPICPVLRATASFTKEQLAKLVCFARENGCIIVYDAAYASYIRSEELPKSIYEIDGARFCAIEINSFSKPAGFTGVRLGWSVVPHTLAFGDGTPVINDWNRIMTTIFNGASNIAQRGGFAALDETGCAYSVLTTRRSCGCSFPAKKVGTCSTIF